MVRMEEHAKAMCGGDLGLHHVAGPAEAALHGGGGQRDPTYTADAVILATGAQAKWLGLSSEEKFKGFGVSACWTRDGFFYRGKEVVVIGGGNTAVEDALFLTNFASKVTLVHRRNSFRAEKIMQDRLFKNPKVAVVWDTEVTEIVGAEALLGVTAVKTRELEDRRGGNPLRGVLRGDRHAPASELVKDQLPLHSGGYVVVEPGSTRTAIPGVFAAGDLTDHIYRQAVTSAGKGCMAALDAEKSSRGTEGLSKVDSSSGPLETKGCARAFRIS